MKQVLLFAGALILSASLFAQQKKADDVIKFKETAHDFGKIKQNDKVNYDFKFTNTGKSPLIITDARASCGCTTPVWPRTPIKPSENSGIKVTFNSAAKMGLQDKQITITANTNPAQNIVHLIGEVTLAK